VIPIETQEVLLGFFAAQGLQACFAAVAPFSSSETKACLTDAFWATSATPDVYRNILVAKGSQTI